MDFPFKDNLTPAAQVPILKLFQTRRRRRAVVVRSKIRTPNSEGAHISPNIFVNPMKTSSELRWKKIWPRSENLYLDAASRYFSGTQLKRISFHQILLTSELFLKSIFSRIGTIKLIFPRTEKESLNYRLALKK